MTKIPQDIEALERMLNDAEGDDMLNTQAIEIYVRLQRSINRARQKRDSYLMSVLRKENVEFERVLKEIGARRHAHVLDRYHQYAWKPLPLHRP